jgi:hypothetical protein
MGKIYSDGTFMRMENSQWLPLYNALILPDAPVYDNKKIWKMKIPLKNKVFAWYLHRGVILTKDNLIKRN